jgi:flagellar basal body-associated protein FliL
MTVLIHTKARRCGFKTLSLMLLVLLLGACSSHEKSTPELLRGLWQVKEGHIVRVIVFQKTGNWTSQGRIPDDVTGIIRKTETVSGKWTLKKNTLEMTGPKPPMETPWNSAGINAFAITRISAGRMQIKLASGKTRDLSRPEQAAPETASGVSNILLDPFVVNLRNTDPLGVERYICIDLNLVLKRHAAEALVYPKVREAVIFFLNSKTFDEVNTLEKIQALRDQLFLLIAPYMNGNLDAVEIKAVMVTSLKEAINSFLTQAEQTRETASKEKK